MSTSSISKYQSGSLGEVWQISYPLILTALSSNLMLFCDRLILAQYSLLAMNATATIGLICTIFQYGGLALTGIATVFVGQYNGAKEFKKLAAPVWQMIWFALMLCILFWPLTIIGPKLFIPDNFLTEGTGYFRWLMFFSCLPPLIAAVASFFIGRGTAKIVTVAAIIANIINLMLDIILIYYLGTVGAAIATVVAQIIQVIILFYVFLNPENTRKFATRIYKFNRELFIKCLKVGFPASISHLMELSGWATLTVFLASVGTDYITVNTIGQNCMFLCLFFNDGLQKGITAIAANMLGSKTAHLIPKLLKSAFLLHGIVIISLFIPLWIYPEYLLDLFLNDTHLAQSELISYAMIALKGLWCWYALEGAVWIIAGVLFAGEDTKFIMYANTINTWIFAVLPAIIWTKYFVGTPEISWGYIAPLYGTISACAFIWRYKSGKWNSRTSTHS
ncbi:MAG: hypothetical protein COB50_03570 [Thiotrichales bacterium]|nr:MAG: hypothetical protein COB50_03570 [Thiotrichales bacterium]